MEPKPVNQYDCSESHQYLGVWNSPNLSMKGNFKALLEKAGKYSTRIAKSGLSKYEVWIAYFACFVPAMTFTLAVCCFTLKELNRLQI